MEEKWILNIIKIYVNNNLDITSENDDFTDELKN